MASLDDRARRVIVAVQRDLREVLRDGQLEGSLVGQMYLRVRDALQQWETRGDLQSQSDEALIDELALSVYLTAGAWGAVEPDAPLHLIADLQQSIARALSLGQPHELERSPE